MTRDQQRSPWKPEPFYNPLDERWDFVVVTRFQDGRLALVTVHQGVVSKDMQVQAAEACNRIVSVYDLRGKNRQERAQMASNWEV